MSHNLKLNLLTKLFHSKHKPVSEKRHLPKQQTKTPSADQWDMSPEDALRVSYTDKK